MTKLQVLLLISATILLIANPLPGSDWPAYLLYQEDGASEDDGFGASVASAGDVNGDGFSDFIIGAPGADPSGQIDAGSAYVFSGADGTLLFQKDGDSGDRLGWSVAGAGDVNADGKTDLIVGAPQADPDGILDAGSAYLYSGADGTLLFQKNGTDTADWFGVSVAEAGDVNGDGRTDFIIGAADQTPRVNAGSVYLYSGATGLLLHQKDGTDFNGRFGNSVAGIKDIDGDGRAEFIVGAPTSSPAGLWSGSIYVYSGATGTLIMQKDGDAAYARLGSSVADCGDIDGDGIPDLIVGAADQGANAAYVYSGATGDLLHQKDGDSSDKYFGYSVAGTGDMNADGIPDYLIGSWRTNSDSAYEGGSAYLYSGSNGSLLLRKNGAVGDGLGLSVAGMGDINSDGRTEFIVSAPFAQPGGLSKAGSVYIYSVCFSTPGDLNGDSSIQSPADVVLELNAVFLGNSFS
ncbi:MAG: integrin alpha, partial [Candidatus Zixiibacteriota bacterium]